MDKNNFKREVLAGATTFSSMAYVIFVNPSILSEGGLDFGAVMIATILVTFLASLLMGLFANYPFCIAPGIGVSAYLTYSIILKRDVPWESGLAAVFIVGILLFLLTIFHLRRRILSTIPHTLLKGIAVGIGLFLIEVALKNAHAIETPAHSFIRIAANPDFAALTFMTTSLGLLAILLWRKWSSAFLIVILLNWIVALLTGHAEWKGIVAMPPSLSPTFFKLDFTDLFKPDFIAIMTSLFLVAVFDSSAGLMILGKAGNFLDKNGKLPRIQKALFPDSIATTIAPLLGSAALAIHIESLSGIRAGGKTGITSITCGLLFLVCIFFYPLFSSIPHFATAPVLIALGIMMSQEVKGIEWKKITEVIPFLTIAITIPLLFSIYHGFAYGFISYLIVKLLAGKWREIPPVCYIFGILFTAQLIYEYVR
ncbi:MAG: NCS2 family permease [Simkaniaceae bacterium]|nr:NCS2 family permease [Simkaniaceae bacterium]